MKITKSISVDAPLQLYDLTLATFATEVMRFFPMSCRLSTLVVDNPGGAAAG